MTDKTDILGDDLPAPPIVEQEQFEGRITELRAREKAHTREGDGIAAARRRLPMVRVDASIHLIGASGATSLLGAFEDRRLLVAYYFMWHAGKPAPVGHPFAKR